MTTEISKETTIMPASPLRGSIELPGDKSISHRYAMLAAIAEGPSEIEHFAESADCASTLDCLSRLGVPITREGNRVCIGGVGLSGLRAPAQPLDAGNSGSTMRMLAGILAGQKFRSVIEGDASLSRRPMKRIAEPLSRMGARIELNENGLPPLAISGGTLKAIRYELPVASAQVKTAVLFAALFAEGTTEVIEPAQTRDHSEIALEHMGAAIDRQQNSIRISKAARLKGGRFSVPGDISSAAFFISAALLVPGSQVELHGVGLNPTRTAFVELLRSMGARIEIESERRANGEPVGNLRVTTSELRGGAVPVAMIPNLIDELPVLAVLGIKTEQGIEFHGARELRVKESDRIAAVAENLRRMGAEIEEFSDGMRIPGGQRLSGAVLPSYGDHRIAMAFSIAGLIAEGATVIQDSACVAISFPSFFQTLASLS